MTNAYERLTELTQSDRAYLLSAPAIGRALSGPITRELYLAFLEQAFHHVKHTLPLMMAVGSRLSAGHLWLQKEIVEYLQEEIGHEQWILDDIAAAGGDANTVRHAYPAVETDAMVAYAYDTVTRRNPAAFFGMVFVLEGTSVALALRAAANIQTALALPDRALTYLRSHGTLDREHVHHLASILDRLDPQEDFPAVTRCAQAMFRLYGNVFRGLERAEAALRAAARHGATACA